MKPFILAAAALFSVLTVEPIRAQDNSTSRTTLEEPPGPTRLSDLGMHINPQLGLSSFEYSGNEGGAHQKLSGGATVEFGEGSHKLETGLLIVQTGSDANLSNGASEQINSTYVTLPMMAKFRILQMQSQTWYLKAGFLTAIQANSSDRGATNPIDVLGSVGLGGRFPFTKKADFIVEATFNRGLLDAVTSPSDNGYNQGVLVLAGLSFKI